MLDHFIITTVKIVGCLFIVLGLLAFCQALVWWIYRNVRGWPTIVAALEHYRENRVASASRELHGAMTEAGLIRSDEKQSPPK